MSTHNMCFHGEIKTTIIIFQLSVNSSCKKSNKRFFITISLYTSVKIQVHVCD